MKHVLYLFCSQLFVPRAGKRTPLCPCALSLWYALPHSVQWGDSCCPPRTVGALTGLYSSGTDPQLYLVPSSRKGDLPKHCRCFLDRHSAKDTGGAATTRVLYGTSA